jgi:hypothetical protein
VSLVARVVRQFHEGREAITLERVVGLPHMPTMSTRLDLRAEVSRRLWMLWPSPCARFMSASASERPTQTYT